MRRIRSDGWLNNKNCLLPAWEIIIRINGKKKMSNWEKFNGNLWYCNAFTPLPISRVLWRDYGAPSPFRTWLIIYFTTEVNWRISVCSLKDYFMSFSCIFLFRYWFCLVSVASVEIFKFIFAKTKLEFHEIHEGVLR